MTYIANVYGRSLKAPTSQDWMFFPIMHKDVMHYMSQNGWFFQSLPPTMSYMDETFQGKGHPRLVAIPLDNPDTYRVDGKTVRRL